MPVITVSSRLLPKLDILNICKQQKLCSTHLAISIFAITLALATVLLFLLHRRRPQVPIASRCGRERQPAGTRNVLITWASRLGVPAGGKAARELQGCVAKELEAPAGWDLTISREGGEVKSGTALAGSGGFPHDGRSSTSAMEEEERAEKPASAAAAPSKSRGVSSTGRSDGSGPSWTTGGLPYYHLSPSSSFPAGTAEQNSDHAGQTSSSSDRSTNAPARGNILAGLPAGFAEQSQQDSMDHDGLGGSFSGVVGAVELGSESGSGSGSAINAPPQHYHQSSMFSFGQYMTDDEHVLYGPPAVEIGVARDSGPRAGSRRFDLDFNQPPLLPTSATTTSATSSHDSNEGRRGHWTDSILLGSPASTTGLNVVSISPSSYPSTSPLLPPPPPITTMTTMEYPFDPAAVMFPGGGAVIDEGITMVPPPVHHDEAGSPVGTGPRHGAAFTSDCYNYDYNTDAGWKRHTRVYGGGVCLACAEAVDGGFYGSRVRPEDKR